MSDLLNQINTAQIHAAEAFVVNDLEEKGLITPVGHKPDLEMTMNFDMNIQATYDKDQSIKAHKTHIKFAKLEGPLQENMNDVENIIRWLMILVQTSTDVAQKQLCKTALKEMIDQL